MADNAIVMPLRSVLSKEGGQQWLTDARIHLPALDLRHNRAPTLDELRALLQRLEGVEVQYYEARNRWYASAHSPNPGDLQLNNDFGEASIITKDDNGAATTPTHLAFRGGDRAVHWRITQELSRELGPQVYLAASDGTPVLITAETDLPPASSHPRPYPHGRQT